MIRKIYSAWSKTLGLYVDSMHVNYPSVVLCLYKALSNQGSPCYKRTLLHSLCKFSI